MKVLLKLNEEEKEIVEQIRKAASLKEAEAIFEKYLNFLSDYFVKGTMEAIKETQMKNLESAIEKGLEAADLLRRK